MHIPSKFIAQFILKAVGKSRLRRTVDQSEQTLCISAPMRLQTVIAVLFAFHLVASPNHASASQPEADSGDTRFVPTIITPVDYQATIFSGTAFAVSSLGHLITADHTIRRGGEIRVFSSQYPHGVVARVLAQDQLRDLALLQIPVATTPIKIATWSSVPTGLEVYALGYPQPRIQGSELKITSGLINAMEGPRGANGFLQFSAPVQQGNSGGPLLSPDGLVVGVVQAKLAVLVGSATKDTPQNVNFAIHSQGISKFLETHQIPSQVSELSLDKTKRPHEIFASAQQSVFSVQVANASQARTAAAQSVPDDMRTVLIGLPKDDQARLYGAFLAGYTRFKSVGSEFVLVKPQPLTSPGAVAEFDFILSLLKGRSLPDGRSFNSMILNARFDCATGAMVVIRQEYKEEAFGNGKTIRALRRKDGSAADLKPIKSEGLQMFLRDSLCNGAKSVS